VGCPDRRLDRLCITCCSKRTCTELTDKTDCGVDNAITAPENTALLNIRVFQVGDVLWDTADYESSVKRRLR
jgi:hypothetical protein